MQIIIPPVRLSAPPVAVVPAGPAPVTAKEVIAPLAVFVAIGLVAWYIISHDAAEDERRSKNPTRGIQTREDFERFMQS